MTHRKNVDLLRSWKTALGRLRERRLLFEPLEDRRVLSGTDLLSHASLDLTPVPGHEDAFEAFTDVAGNGGKGFRGREAWSFAVTIGSPPEVVQPIADVTAAEDDPDTVISLGPVFDDPDLPWGDQLTYTATVTMPLDSLVAQVSQSNYTAMHQNLLYTGLGDNRGFGPEHDLAQANIYTYFVGLGLETALEPVLYQGQTYYNVVGVHAGATRPDDVYLVGAHYDSVNNPGADDNASGVAAVMELARVMTQYQFDATLVFVAFDREEQGLHGAYAYTAAHDTSKILGMLSLDMIAYNPPGTHHDKVRFYDSNGVGRIKADLATAFASYSGGLATVDSGKINASDHYPFERVGVDAALVIEYNVWSNPHYHKATDAVETLNYIDYAYATKVTRGVMGYLATAVGLTSPSDLLTVTVDGEDLVLDYAADAHGIADVRVRATDSQGLYAEDTFRVTVSPVNDAPVLNPLGPMSLALIAQDDLANPGTLVRNILADGGPGTITDADWGALPGIAVTAVDNAHGTWQYTINNGRVWHAFGMPTAAEARLLGSDAGTRIRFVPAAGWYGSIDPGITFRAWDHTEGFRGQTADASVHGDATAFSTALGTASITVDQIIAPRIDMTIVHEPSATDGNGEATSLPGSADWVHEWQSFWVEIWVSTPDASSVGVAQAMVDLQYRTDCLTAQEFVYGPAFTLAQTGTIDDGTGVVSGIGGRTVLTDVGDDAYVLLARVRFVSTADDLVPVDEERRNIGPYDMQMALAGGQSQLVGGQAALPALGKSPGTGLWSVMFDIDDNDQIDFGDFSFFAAAFGRTVGAPDSEPPYVWWADFDKSGRVDFGDLAFFAPNFGKTRSAVQAGDQTLVFPPDFPEAWRAVPTAPGGEGEAMDGGDVQQPSFAGTVLLAGFDTLEESRVPAAADAMFARLGTAEEERTPTWLRPRFATAEQESARIQASQSSESPVALCSRSDASVAAPANGRIAGMSIGNLWRICCRCWQTNRTTGCWIRTTPCSTRKASEPSWGFRCGLSQAARDSPSGLSRRKMKRLERGTSGR
jgi:hypothetical protein